MNLGDLTATSSQTQSAFVAHWCDGDIWGPFFRIDGHWNLTPCFANLILGALRAALLPLLAFRFLQTYRAPPSEPRKRSIKYMLQLTSCILIALICIIDVSEDVLNGFGHAHMIIPSTIGIMTWILCVFVMLEERIRFLPNNWILRGYWLAELFLSTVTFPAYTAGLYKSQAQKVVLYVITLVLQSLIFILTMLKQQARFYKPMTEDAKRQSVLMAKPVIEEEEEEEEDSEELQHQGSIQQQSTSQADESTSLLGKRPTSTSYDSSRTTSTTSLASAAEASKPKPIRKPSFFSKISFHFIRTILRLHGDYKVTLCFVLSRPMLDISDLSPLEHEDQASILSQQFIPLWEAEMRNKKPSLVGVLAKMFRSQIIFSGVIRLFNETSSLAFPIVFYIILLVTQRNPQGEYDYSTKWGYIATGIMAVLGIESAFGKNWYTFYMYHVGLRIRSTIIMAVYRKSLGLSGLSRHKFPPGVIINHMAVDPTTLVELCPNIHLIWAIPLQILVLLAILCYGVGWSAIAGILTMVFIIPVNIILGKKLMPARIGLLTEKDTRIKLLSEVIGSIKTVKLMVWEAHLHGELNEARRREIRYLFRYIFLRSLILIAVWGIPLIAQLAVFSVFVFVGKKNLTVSTAFLPPVVFGQMNLPLSILPKFINDLAVCVASLKRITTFLLADEIDQTNVEQHDFSASAPAIKSEGTSFVWEDTGEIALNNLNFTINQGELIAIIGQVGCGKSALLRAMLGSVKRSHGKMSINGHISYAAQSSWIQNMSFRDNITFGKPYDPEWYDRVVRACELKRDLTILVGGDTAEIGESGSTLSGGQKQRLSLARAVYQNEDIFFFDDTLSAVDANVGENIFNNCVRGILAGKTRVLVTQQFQYLNRVDRIIVMKAGEIVEQGTYQELASNKSSEFARLNSNYEAQVAHAEEKKEAIDAPKTGGEGGLMTLEEHNKGSVPWRVYVFYLMQSGIFLFIFVCFVFFAASFANNAIYYWLAQWTKSSIVPASEGSGAVPKMSNGLGLGVFAALIMGTCLGNLVRYLLMAKANMNASEGMHDKPLQRLLCSPMSFFHTTPVGRILNRFSEDMQIVDDKLSFSMANLLSYIFFAIVIIASIVLVLPYVTPLILPLGFIYFYVQEWFTFYARELFRLDVIARSPLYTRFSETLSGLDTINCFKQRKRFVTELEKKLNHQQRAFYAIQVANGWLGVRIDFVSLFAMLVTALIGILDRDTQTGGDVAFALLSGSSFFWLLPALVTTVADVKLSMISSQRLVHIYDLPQEGPLEDRDARVIPPPGWPSKGHVEFRKYTLQYRHDLPPSVTDLSVDIPPGEKIGVVGRTGAGKSSLIVALFRLCEAASGKVFVDEVDISKVALHTLRSRLCVIPQDPVLFRGTLRKNLDVLDCHSEESLLNVLAAVNLQEQILSKPKGLDCEVTESGQNFSVGERQLICLARGLLRKASVIVLDEATANIDLATEEKIHQVLFESCKGSTMLLIAHRVHTIMKCDKILMLERGQVLSFGTPEQLMQTSPDFANLIKHSGLKDGNKHAPTVETSPEIPPPPTPSTSTAPSTSTTTTLVELP